VPLVTLADVSLDRVKQRGLAAAPGPDKGDHCALGLPRHRSENVGEPLRQAVPFERVVPEIRKRIISKESGTRSWLPVRLMVGGWRRRMADLLGTPSPSHSHAVLPAPSAADVSTRH
jgi:hypothetical protein